LRHIRNLVYRPGGSGLTDRALLERFATGRDESAFAVVMQRHGPVVLAVCRRILQNEHDAEDAFQATFLVLARKAAGLRWQESVGSWLYEVASRIALKAKGRAGRQQALERQAEIMGTPEPVSTAARGELQSALGEELRRLPEKYRLPVVLCLMEGLSRSEAAQQLGWKEGTVAGRLARARDLLQKRLAHRGCALSAGCLGLALAESRAAVPAALTDSTLKAVVPFTAGATVAGTASAQAVALANGMLQAMVTAKLKLAAAVILAVGLLGTGTVLVRQVLLPTAAAESSASEPANGKAAIPGSQPSGAQDKAVSKPGLPTALGVQPGPAPGAKGNRPPAGLPGK
jgi:RNA polymerase sigma factor (sigma-70 family)